MQLKIDPVAELTLKLNNKKIGRLDSLNIDLSSGSLFMAIPKVSLNIVVYAKEFGDDQKLLSTLIDKVGKYKFLQLTIVK